MAKTVGLLVTLILLFSQVTLAHGSHGHAEGLPGSIEVLSEKLNELKLRAISQNRPVSNAEYAAVGEELLRKVELDLKTEMSEQASVPIAKKIVSGIREKVLDQLNVVALGQWLWNTALTRGGYVAAAIGIAELTEKATIIYGSLHPQFAFLIPVAASEVTCIGATAIAMGIPEAKIKIQLWLRSGGLIRGIKLYYQKLLRQREVSPLDWNKIVLARELPSPESDESLGVFTVTQENRIMSHLSTTFWMMLDPRGLAMKNATPNVSIRELESILKSSKIEFDWVALIKKDNVAYSSLLLDEIFKNEVASQKLRDLLTERGLRMFRPPHPAALSAEEILTASAAELSKAGERLEVTAGRILFALNQRKEAVLSEVLEHKKALSWKQGRMMRKINAKLDSADSLRGISETEHETSSISDWENLISLREEADHLINELDHPACKDMLVPKH